MRLPRITASLLLAVALVAGLLLPARSPGVDAATALTTPPSGGLTLGLAGTDSLQALVAAQSFDVQAVWLLDPATQQWLSYIPGAPASVNTLTDAHLHEDSVVMLRRTGPPGPAGRSPGHVLGAAITGQGTAFDTPPAGGLVQGVAGTNDPATLVSRQPFEVASVLVLHVPSQQWLTYVDGAPSWANTLTTGRLREDSIVTIRRGSTGAPAAASVPTTVQTDDNPGETGGGFDAEAEALMLQLINAERAAHGLAPLTLDPVLVTLARGHSADMHDRGYFSHRDPNGTSPFDRMRAAGISYNWAAENISDYRDVEAAHRALMQSQGHRANILDARATHLGIGILEQPGGGFLITQKFRG